jgi:hypothetical protein
MAPGDPDYISKDDLFTVLASMKLTLPRSSKMSTEDMSKRLKDGLNAAQRTDVYIPGDFLDPTELKDWVDVEELPSTIASFQNSPMDGFEERMKLNRRRTSEETLKEIQDMILWMGIKWKDGVTSLYLCDPAAEDWAIAVKVRYRCSRSYLLPCKKLTQSTTMASSFWLRTPSTRTRRCSSWVTVTSQRSLTSLLNRKLRMFSVWPKQLAHTSFQDAPSFAFST